MLPQEIKIYVSFDLVHGASKTTYAIENYVHQLISLSKKIWNVHYQYASGWFTAKTDKFKQGYNITR